MTPSPFDNVTQKFVHSKSSHGKGFEDHMTFIKVFFDGPEMSSKGRRALFRAIMEILNN